MGCDMLFKQVITDVPEKALHIVEHIKLLKGSLGEAQEAFWAYVDRYRKEKDFQKLRYYIGINEEIEEYIKVIDDLLKIYNNSVSNQEEDADVLNGEGIQRSEYVSDANNKANTENGLSKPYPVIQKISPNNPLKDLSLISPKRIPDPVKEEEIESHSLYENYLHKKPCAFKIEENIIRVDTWQQMLVKTCEYLFEKDEKLFLTLEHKPHMNGATKKYFSSNPDDMTKRAKLIGGKMYVELNQGANLIRNLVKKLLKEYGMSVVDYRVYYSDVSPLIDALKVGSAQES
jgi:hypothetical protein